MANLTVPILVDECVTNRVAAGLRAHGFTAEHVADIGRRGRSDPDQLSFAAEQGMAFLTYNIAHFQELHREWGVIGKPHAGILLANDRIYQRNPGGLIHDVRATLHHYAELHEGRDDWLHNQILWVMRATE